MTAFYGPLIPGASTPSSGTPRVPVPAPGEFDPTLPDFPIGPPTPPGTPRTPGEANPAAFADAGPAFWKWAAAIAIFWIAGVAANTLGGTWAQYGSAFAWLVCSTVLLTQGKAAIANLEKLFT